MPLETFNPEDLEPIKDLCAEGVIRQSFQTTREYCRTGRFPAVKVAGIWHTTRVAAKGFIYKDANAAFRRVCA